MTTESFDENGDENDSGGTTESSRQSAEGAGWGLPPGETWQDLASHQKDLPLNPTQKILPKFNWLRLSVLWASRNQLIASVHDLVPSIRKAIVSGLPAQDFTIDFQDEGDLSFLLMGDTGEGDNSQFALVRPLNSVAEATHPKFLFICSDVIYPLGRVDEYLSKFYYPYKTVQLPIYAIPGNHDWYDGLEAFMANFVEGATDPITLGSRSKDLVRRVLWRTPNRYRNEKVISDGPTHRPDPAQLRDPNQPGPYFAIETAAVRFVCIDTGIRGTIDEDQAAWMVKVSQGPKPKILLTGKPIVVDGKVCDGGYKLLGAPEGKRTVLELVHTPEFHYIATIGGDYHNYQHYPVWLPRQNRTIHHIVSGGGGAFMHATHLIPPVKLRYSVAQGKEVRSDAEADMMVDEKEFRAYPLRRDSLALFSRVVASMRLVPGSARIDDVQAAQLLNQYFQRRGFGADLYQALRRPGQDPDGQEKPRHLTMLQRVVNNASLLWVGGKRFQKLLAPVLDTDDTPFFKHFLDIDVSSSGVRIRCHAVTGAAGEQEIDPPIEDEFTIPIPPVT